MKKLWEILVPTIHPHTGKPIRTRYHRVWDNKVRQISGGLTITEPTKGEWISPKGDIIKERMIPVRFLATDEEASEIVDYTIDYYKQEAVLAYVISAQYILRYNTT